MRRKPAIMMFVAAMAIAMSVYAVEPVSTGWYGNTAVQGYDVVAYFDQGKPIKGQDQYSTEWKGAEWYFASAGHLEAFSADPERYAPQYGGYCAWAVAHNSTAVGDPHQWSIVDDRLYLNYNAEFHQKWARRKAELIEKGNENWPGLLDE